MVIWNPYGLLGNVGLAVLSGPSLDCRKEWMAKVVEIPQVSVSELQLVLELTKVYHPGLCNISQEALGGEHRVAGRSAILQLLG